MNKPITQLHKISDNRMFRVFFTPDKEHEDFDVEMKFIVLSVNRQTGEIQFSLDRVDYQIPEDTQ